MRANYLILLFNEHVLWNDTLSGHTIILLSFSLAIAWVTFKFGRNVKKASPSAPCTRAAICFPAAVVAVALAVSFSSFPQAVQYSVLTQFLGVGSKFASRYLLRYMVHSARRTVTVTVAFFFCFPPLPSVTVVVWVELHQPGGTWW